MDAILDLAERLDAARSLDAVWAATAPALASREVEWLHHAYCAVAPEAEARPSSMLRFTTLPPDWSAHHAEQRYWLVDASVTHCGRSLAVMPTGLEFAEAAGDAGWARMCADAEGIGIGCGLAVPLRGSPGSSFGGAALLTRLKGARFAAWRQAQGRVAVLMTQMATQRVLELAELDAPAPRRLSPRERECLVWLATGLRSDRIAERLGLSRATVDLHLARARRRLGARTREQAVARALAFGLLQP